MLPVWPQAAHLSQSESESPLSEPDSKSESARESLRGASTSFGLWSAQWGGKIQLEAQQEGRSQAELQHLWTVWGEIIAGSEALQCEILPRPDHVWSSHAHSSASQGTMQPALIRPAIDQHPLDVCSMPLCLELAILQFCHSAA